MTATNEEIVYTDEGVMAQIWVAFGQGTGMTRVAQKAALTLQARYSPEIAGHLEEWGTEAVQVLERIRAIGKLAALKATERGSTIVTEEDVKTAMATVERESDTSWCPPDQ